MPCEIRGVFTQSGELLGGPLGLCPPNEIPVNGGTAAADRDVFVIMDNKADDRATLLAGEQFMEVLKGFEDGSKVLREEIGPVVVVECGVHRPLLCLCT